MSERAIKSIPSVAIAQQFVSLHTTLQEYRYLVLASELYTRDSGSHFVSLWMCQSETCGSWGDATCILSNLDAALIACAPLWGCFMERHRIKDYSVVKNSSGSPAEALH
eukprot:6022789-Amphidinium_carterae.1